MNDKKSIREMLNFQDLSEEEKKARGILGRLYGPCASIIAPTRNERFYSDKVWENVFNKNEIVKEMFANGGIPMELDHPADREETCSEKIAAMLPAPPKKDQDGHLICYVDIIDTPMGRIAYQLAKYGFKLGISSRGTGDLYTDENGNESVDPETYDFTTFDLVLLPAVKDARLSMCEGLDSNKLKLKKALKESYDSASKEDQRIMKEALNDLNLNSVLTEDIDVLPGGTPANPEMIPDAMTIDEDVEDTKLQEAEGAEETPVEEESVDTEEVEEPKEDPEEESNDKEEETDKLTVSNFLDELKDYDKGLELEFKPIVVDDKEYPVESFGFDDESEDGKLVVTVNYSPAMDNNIDEDDGAEENVEPAADEEIPDEAENAEKKAADDGDDEVMESLKEMIRQKDLLETELKEMKAAKTVTDGKVKKLEEDLNKYKESFARASLLAADSKKFEKEVQQLTEQLSAKDVKLKELQTNTHSVAKLTESVNDNAKQVKVLTERLATVKNDLQETETKLTESTATYKKKLQESANVAKFYKKKCDDMMQRYIESKASILGVRATEITSKLNENYSLDDVDKVCDEIMTYDVGSRRLPYDLGRDAKVKLPESTQKKPASKGQDYGYEIDDSLFELAGIKKF